jgi:hypothetical protein
MAEAGDVHRVTAGITTIQYTTAFLAPVAAGALWDASGWNGWSYLMVLAAGLVMALAPIGMEFPAAMRQKERPAAAAR